MSNQPGQVRKCENCNIKVYGNETKCPACGHGELKPVQQDQQGRGRKSATKKAQRKSATKKVQKKSATKKKTQKK
jgi:hypothetical protein